MESLRAPDLASYLTALGNLSTVDKDDFVFVLRPYMWHVHEVAFQDVYDLSVEVFQLLKQNKATLPPAEYKSITTFIKGFVNAGNYDGSGFVVVMGALETAAIVDVRTLKKALSSEILDRYETMLKQLMKAQHSAYHLLRTIGADHLDLLFDFTITLAPVYQEFILHALDAFPKNAGVIRFYQRYLEQVSVPSLEKQAREYLSAVAA